MKLYSVFSLYVVKKDDVKFICRKKNNKKYIEFLTNKKMKIKDEKEIESLSDYFSLLEVMNYQTFEPLMLTKDGILLKYIEINEKVVDKTDYYNANIDNILQEIDERSTQFKKLQEKDPERAKMIAENVLKNVGILDDNNQVKEPYDSFVYKKTK